jgi:hypothetical protein
MELDEEKRARIYDFIAYLVSSARGLLVEPQMYGPFRCLDAVSRFIRLLDDLGIRDAYLSELKKEIDECKYLVLTDEEKFREFVVLLNVKLAQKVRGILSL